MTSVLVKADHATVESIVFEWLLAETGDRAKAARLAASGYVERVLDANPGLAALQAGNADSLPIGAEIVLPDMPAVWLKPTVKLWE